MGDYDFFNNSNFKPVPTRNRKSPVFSLLIIGGVIGLGIVSYFSFPDIQLSKYFGGHINVIDVPGESIGPVSDIEDIIKKVGKHIILPDDETPTVATVSDPEKLKDQDFFGNAKTGDRVLIYTNAQKAILYDPIADIIINVAPINLGSQGQ